MSFNASPPKAQPGAERSLLAGGVAAVLASTCCLGPLLLLTLGFSGAWIANLTLLEPLRPLFVGAALVALWMAARRIWQPVVDCQRGDACAVPAVRRVYKLLFTVIAALVVVALAFPYVAHWFY
ncbi:MAG: mercuric ion transporter MerT [Rubrivivax sp.]